MGKNKGKPIFRLEKIPTEELLRHSRQEVGKLNSYIDELKYDIENLKKEINKLKSDKSQLRKLLNIWQNKYKNLLFQSLSDKKNDE